MGLLERALQYKQKLNETGKYTLIDSIKGPAETEFVTKTDASQLDEPDDEQLSSEDEKVDFLQGGRSGEEENNDINNLQSSKDESIDDYVSIKDDEKILNLSADVPNYQLEEQNFSVGREEEASVDTESEVNVIFDQESSKPELVITDKEVNFHNELSLMSHEENIDSAYEDAPLGENSSGNFSEIEDQIIVPDYFDDIQVFHEIQKELMTHESVEEIYSTVLFSVMGQVGVSSASIISQDGEDKSVWQIVDYSGLKIDGNSPSWSSDSIVFEMMRNNHQAIDVDELKHNEDLLDEYYKMISIDSRLLVPMYYKEELLGVLSVGEKINGEDFTLTEVDFLTYLSEMSSHVITFIKRFEQAESERLALRIESEILADVEIFQNSLLGALNVNELNDIIEKNFYSLGLESYAVFMADSSGDGFIPVYFDREDSLGFASSGFIIRSENRLLNFLHKKNASIIIENFVESSVISETFGQNRVVLMDTFIAYPYVISGRLAGFIAIFRINPDIALNDVDIRVRKISRFIFPYIDQIYQLDPERRRFNDVVENIYCRIESELKNAGDLKIPLSLAMISIKNYKKFFDLFGKVETENMLKRIEEIIKSRLSTGDFSVRIDRHKYLLVLPGKEKNYTANLSSVIKNEIFSQFSFDDFKLLISPVSAEYPSDGKDIFTLLDFLD